MHALRISVLCNNLSVRTAPVFFSGCRLRSSYSDDSDWDNLGRTARGRSDDSFPDWENPHRAARSRIDDSFPDWENPHRAARGRSGDSLNNWDNPRRTARGRSVGSWGNDSTSWKDFDRSPFDNQGFSDSRGWNDRFTNLKKPKWSQETTTPVEKNFYKQHQAVEERCEGTDLEYYKQHSINTRGQNVLRPVLSFDEIEFPEYIKQTMKHQEWTEPTPTQAMGWPLALTGRDVIGISRTGSGKTAAFLLPGLIHIMNQEKLQYGEGPKFVCLVPTRELAQQVGQVALTFARPLRKKTAIVYGGAKRERQLNVLNQGPEILIATPGRLLDFLEMESTNMDRCTYLVLDEADRMLDMGFEPQIRKILGLIRPDRQTLMYTATWPEEVQDLAEEFQTDPVQVTIGSTKLHANSNIEQRLEFCHSSEKIQRLLQLLKGISQEDCNKTLIFVATKSKANMLEQKMRNVGWPANAIHGDKTQMMRDRILKDFRSGRVPVLIATDVASRGLDVKDIGYVINMDFPNVIEDYVHRIGRTARGEKSGVSISMFTDEDFKLAKDLVGVLVDSNQHIPEQLQRVAQHLNQQHQNKRFSRYRGKKNTNAGDRHYESAY